MTDKHIKNIKTFLSELKFIPIDNKSEDMANILRHVLKFLEEKHPNINLDSPEMTDILGIVRKWYDRKLITSRKPRKKIIETIIDPKSFSDMKIIKNIDDQIILLKDRKYKLKYMYVGEPNGYHIYLLHNRDIFLMCETFMLAEDEYGYNPKYDYDPVHMDKKDWYGVHIVEHDVKNIIDNKKITKICHRILDFLEENDIVGDSRLHIKNYIRTPHNYVELSKKYGETSSNLYKRF